MPNKETVKTIVLTLLIGAILGFVGGIKISADNQHATAQAIQAAVKTSK